MKKISFIIITFILIVLFLLKINAEGVQEQNDYTEPIIEKINSSELKNTVISSHMEHEIIENKNIIYCSTFQLAWNELYENIIGEKISLKDEPDMVKYLNKRLSTKSDLSENCYVAVSGFGHENIAEKINQELKAKFGESADLFTEFADQFTDEDSESFLTTFSALLKNLEFETAFIGKYEIDFESNNENNTVKAFGLREYDDSKLHNELVKQVSILFYDYESSDCIISLHTKSINDEIILAKISPQNTLLETINFVLSKTENITPEKLNLFDSLYIPKVIFHIEHDYNELIGKIFMNKGFEALYIDKAKQEIYFKFDEKGASLRSAAGAAASGMSKMVKHIIFDKPFLLLLKEKNAKYPYLVIWIGNNELLINM